MVSLDKETLSDKMVAFRKRHRLDQQGFARGCGISKKHTQNIERGHQRASAECEAKILVFMNTATKEKIDALRGPGRGNSTSPVKRGPKLTRAQLHAAELRHLSQEELDEELLDLLRK